jgi:PAS domain S-box-containing protein
MSVRETLQTGRPPSRHGEIDLRLALKAGRFGTWSLELESGELTASDTCLATFGRNPGEFSNHQQWAAAAHPDDSQRVAEAFGNSITTGADFDIEYRLLTPAGEVRWVSMRAQPVRDDSGAIVRLIGISQDVTTRMRQDILRRALADLSDRISELSEPADLAYAASQILAKTLHVSRAGYGFIDPVAETITIERDWNAPGIQTLAGVLNFREYGSYIDDLKRGDTVVVADAEKDPRTAQTADVLKAISAQSFINMPVHEEGGLVALLYLNHAEAREWPEEEIAFIREVAARTRTAEARRTAEINLRALTDSLEAQVQARTQALMATEDALRQAQKMEAVGQLTGGVAHDFNNLLTVIRSSVDLLAKPGLPEARRQVYVEAISATVTRASRLTSQLLSFARRQALQPEVFDAGANVTGIIEMIGTLAGSGVQIRSYVPSDICYIHADPSQFDTALVNMAVNARDAMNGEGDMTLTIEPASQIVDPRCMTVRTGDFVAVSVSDTGSGIAPCDLDRIFEPFFTTKPFGQGTGLGLSQVFGFARQSGGDVMVSSELGKGTRVTLYLPRARQ